MQAPIAFESGQKYIPAVLEERYNELRADLEDAYATVLAMRERVIAFEDAIRQPPPVGASAAEARRAVPGGGEDHLAEDWHYATAEAIERMTLTAAVEYCAGSVGQNAESARGPRGFFASVLFAGETLDVNERTVLWRLLAQPAEDSPTLYAHLRQLPREFAQDAMIAALTASE